MGNTKVLIPAGEFQLFLAQPTILDLAQ